MIETPRVTATRVLDEAIVHPGLHPSIGENIQGPSLIRVPDWVQAPLGRYYLYFADHKGAYIRLAYADDVTGPWRVHAPGTLHLAGSGFPTEAPAYTEADAEAVRARLASGGMRFPHDPVLDMTIPHIASPDVHVDNDQRRIRMYFHGLERFGEQVTRVALSADGLAFNALPEVHGPSYFRVVQIGAAYIAMAMPGRFYRSDDPLSGFVPGPQLFGPMQRHAALCLRGDLLYVFYTDVGDAPERIRVAAIDTRAPFAEWTASAPSDVLAPERVWEGADQPNAPSLRSVAPGRVNQLRDPAVFVEDDGCWLLYAVAGESGIGLARLTFRD